MLSEGEKILLTANQSRIMPGGSLTTPDNIYITDRRVIFRNPRWFGMKADVMDYMYRDLANVELHKGIFTSEVELTPRFNSEKMTLPAVPKKIAEKLFGMVRKGINGEFGLGLGEVSANVIVRQQKPDDPIAKLEKLSVLKEKGMLSDKEFEVAKTKLLGEI